MLCTVPAEYLVCKVELTIGNVEVVVAHGTVAAVPVEPFLVEPVLDFVDGDWRYFVCKVYEQGKTIYFTLGCGVVALFLCRDGL